jgi:hypothetical protein
MMLLSVPGVLAACGGEARLTCDEPRRYQQAVDHERLQTPEGLDGLQPFLEMPVPQANPRPERPEGSPCLELPPQIEVSE